MIHIWHEDSTSSATTSFWQFLSRKSCKLYRYKKSSKDKANNLWNGTLARQIVYRACKQK